MAVIIGNKRITLIETDSTNNYATQLVKKGICNEGDVILADYQTLGRGQIANSWESEKGKNILMSIVLFPNFVPVQYQFFISKITTLALYDTLSKYVDQISVKWPNDIYIGNNKVAGILIENSIMGSTIDTTIIGIGLNINQTKFTSGAPNPISLAQLLNHEVDRDDVLVELTGNLDRWYNLLRKEQLAIIDQSYHSVLYRLGLKNRYRDKDGIFTGVILGLNPIGQLIIQKENNIRKEYHFKEVEFLID